MDVANSFPRVQILLLTLLTFQELRSYKVMVSNQLSRYIDGSCRDLYSKERDSTLQGGGTDLKQSGAWQPIGCEFEKVLVPT